MKNNFDFGHKYKYTNHNKPIYRGIHPFAFSKNSDDYKVGSIG